MQQNTATANRTKRHIQLQVPAEVYKKFRAFCLDEDTNMRAKALQLIEEYTHEKSKSKKKSFLEMNKTEIEALYGEATRRAIKKHHAAGLFTTHGDEKGVYRLYPDGRKEYIEAYTEDSATTTNISSSRTKKQRTSKNKT
ncbi:MAG: hypothetical protein C0399_12135 [Syntrophus sp. (in: bacteria)]|nr:hypothetical protein [Syntrophus sp. (in: bacteria)]